jgi:hypothetical protein
MSVEKSYKEASGFLNQFTNTCISILKVLLRSKFFLKLPEADQKSCVILGNGPSLKTSINNHETFLKSHSLFCVNSFAMSEAYTEFKPQQYVILDNSFWESDGKIILDTLDALNTKTTWPLKLYLPSIAAGSSKFNTLAKKNPNIQIHYYNYTVFKGFTGISNWFFSKNLGMPQSQNVLVASIFIAINSGFKEIFLVGADHTWHENLHVDEKNVLCLKDVHFYDNEIKTNYVPFKKGMDLKETFKVHEIFATWSKTFYGYIILEKYAAYKKCKIYNTSEVTFIDAFERKKL